jgi:hypothetical protein
MLALTKRPYKRVTDCAVIRTWRSQDGRWAVEEINSLFGLGTRYITVETSPDGSQGILSRHRERGAAVKQLEKIARKRG